MTVSYQTILKKMATEIQKAQLKKENQEAVQQHVTHIKLLCDLIIEDASSSKPQTTTDAITDEEMKMMVGDAHKQSRKTERTSTVQSTQIYDPDESESLKGDSIFDF